MHAIVTAGGTPQPKEPLYEETRGGYKALLEIHGKPMIQWVLDALSGAQLIERIIVVGLPIYTDLSCSKPMQIIEDQGNMIANIKAGVDELFKTHPSTQQVLAISSDIPTITSPMVDWMIQTVLESDDDVYYNVIERSVMERRFPNSRRTYTHLKELEVCGGDLNAIRASVATPENSLYARLIEARKNPIRQASILGFDTLLLLLLRQVSLEQAAVLVSKRLGINGRAILCPYPEMGMDVDKPHQLEMVRADLAKQSVV
ncbi:MAG TPA: nucleotidyltransferase family protein [Anaerolineaceae bacterium]|jgi:GTP:adenosylcobinamide-phosphate guanylyltransferase